MFKLLFFLNIKSYLKNAKTKLNINYNCNQKNLLNVLLPLFTVNNVII